MRVALTKQLLAHGDVKHAPQHPEFLVHGRGLKRLFLPDAERGLDADALAQAIPQVKFNTVGRDVHQSAFADGGLEVFCRALVFNRTAPGGNEPLPALTRAGISHLYFECIHPFEDGNGRIGRALAQSVGQPSLIALAATILARRGRYYNALEEANKANEITPWLKRFAGTTIEAQRWTLALTEFLIDKAKLFDRLGAEINERQKKALLRMFEEGPEGFKGGMSAGKYATITGASPATTTRDLTDSG